MKNLITVLAAFLGWSFVAQAESVRICVDSGNRCVIASGSEEKITAIQILDGLGNPAALSTNQLESLKALKPRLESKEQLVADVVLKFVPPGEVLPLDLLDFSGPLQLLKENLDRESPWTMICDAIGQEKQATYTANGRNLSVVAMVGVPESRCRGRCGNGCGFDSDQKEHAYTQECFNHDMCHTIVGEQLGQCADEMKAAVKSYLFAPDCD